MDSCSGIETISKNLKLYGTPLGNSHTIGMAMLAEPTLIHPIECISKLHPPSSSLTFHLAQLFRPVYPNSRFSNNRTNKIIAIKIIKTGIIPKIDSREQAVYS